MARHKHKMGPWQPGGPKRGKQQVCDRFCIKEGCKCDDECCWQTKMFIFRGRYWTKERSKP